MSRLFLIACLCFSFLTLDSQAVTHHRSKPTVKQVVASPTPAPVTSTDSSLNLSPTIPAVPLSTNVVVLPPEFQNAKVVVADTPEFKDLAAKNSELQKSLDNEKKTFDQFKTNNDKLLAEKAKNDEAIAQKLAKMEATQHKWSLFGWSFGIAGFLGIGAVVALCIFDPAIIPVVFNVILGIFRVIARIFGASIEGIGKALSSHLAAFEHAPAVTTALPVATVTIPPSTSTTVVPPTATSTTVTAPTKPS